MPIFLLQTLLLIYMSFQDLKRLSITLVPVTLLLIISLFACFFLTHFNHLWISIYFLCGLLLVKLFGRIALKKTALGLGDILIFFALSFTLTITGISCLLIISGLYAMVIAPFLRKKSDAGIPFVPAITLSYLSLFCLQEAFGLELILVS